MEGTLGPRNISCFGRVCDTVTKYCCPGYEFSVSNFTESHLLVIVSICPQVAHELKADCSVDIIDIQLLPYDGDLLKSWNTHTFTLASRHGYISVYEMSADDYDDTDQSSCEWREWTVVTDHEHVELSQYSTYNLSARIERMVALRRESEAKLELGP